MTENELAKIIVNICYNIHVKLGPGLLESAYKECLKYDLEEKGFTIEKELPVPIVYKNIKLEHGYRIDLLVEKKLVIEVNSVDALIDVYFAQLLTYLRLGNYKLRLLINFNVKLLKNGIKRIIN